VCSACFGWMVTALPPMVGGLDVSDVGDVVPNTVSMYLGSHARLE
jgi:hypothetical protein